MARRKYVDAEEISVLPARREAVAPVCVTPSEVRHTRQDLRAE